MQPSKIHLRDVLARIDEVTGPDGQYISHDVGFITYSRSGAGHSGRYRILRGVHKSGSRYDVKNNQIRTFTNATGSQTRAVHIRLILMFDGMRVIW